MIRTCPSCGAKNRVASAHLADDGRCGRCKAALAAVDAPVEFDGAASDAEFDDIVDGAAVPVLVDFHATWCGPCKVAAPQVKQLAREMKGKAVVVKVDTDRHPRLAQRYGVRGIPHFVVLSRGRPVVEQSGLVDAAHLRGMLQRAAAR